MKPQDLHYSTVGLQLTEKFEGCKLAAYQDSVGVWTIGYGHTRAVHAGMTCTEAQAIAWLVDDVASAEADVRREVRADLSQGEYDALVDFVFNLGGLRLEHSTLLAKLNAGDHAGAAAEFEKWDKAGGVAVAGLLRRRQAEAQEFRA